MGGASGTSSGSSTGGAFAGGLTKVVAGEYEVFYLVNGQLLAFAGGPYEGITGGGVPATPIDVPAGTTFIDAAGGLHQSLGVDSTGHVWTWGDNTDGQAGNGQDKGPSANVLPSRIMRDNLGNDFGDVIAVTAGANAGTEAEWDGALKSDGTVWVWGSCAAGLIGDGSLGGDVVYPTQVEIPLPAGVKITKFLAGYIGLALASDGSVWVWGGGGNPNDLGTGNTAFKSPQRIKGLPGNIEDIALGGQSFAYALTSDGDLYGWGTYGLNLGYGTYTTHSCYAPVPTPMLLTKAPDGGVPVLDLPHPVKVLMTDALTTHVILTDGTLWGWGDDAQGEVGDGQQLDFATTTPPYNWDFGQCELLVQKPVQIAADVTEGFVALFSNSPAVFYTYAMTTSGKLYSWGRNKGGLLGNGVFPANSHQAAGYPDSWNVTKPTLVSPLTVTHPTLVSSPYCVANPAAANCTCPNDAGTC